MKKIYLLPLLFAFCFSDIAAQETGVVGFQPIAEFEDSPGNPMREYGKASGNSNVPKEVTGNFYIEEDFVPGTLNVEGGDKELEVLLRLNVVEDAVEIKLKGKNKVYVLPKQKNLVYTTPDYTYRFDTFKTSDGNVQGFWIHYFEGENLRFVSKPVAHIRKEVQPTSGYGTYKPAHYSIKHSYYLINRDGSVKEVRLKEKDFRKELSEENGMKNYFSEHKVNNVEDVVEMLEYYEEQQSSDT